jgi:hypothetical protein
MGILAIRAIPVEVLPIFESPVVQTLLAPEESVIVRYGGTIAMEPGARLPARARTVGTGS